jgi:ornithine carbamoyltransferase
MRHLLRIDQLSPQDINEIFQLTRVLKEKRKKGIAHRSLEGKVLALLFEKASTRTRVSFEVGIYELGGLPIYLNAQEIQLGRGETPADTARVLSRYVDGIVIRTYSQEKIEEMARNSSVPVINGLSDLYHPCQILSDLFTIEEKRGNFRDAIVAYIGDGNNIANSWIQASLLTGFELRLSCPKGYWPLKELVMKIRSGSYPIKMIEDPMEAAKGADILYTDVWVSMGNEKEEKERKMAFKAYQVNGKLLSMAKKNCLVMHCLPAHRGEEITDEVIDGPNSIVFDQAENRLHVQKAILEILMK